MFQYSSHLEFLIFDSYTSRFVLIQFAIFVFQFANGLTYKIMH